MPRALFSSLIGSEDVRPKHPIIKSAPLIFLSLLSTGKLVNNNLIVVNQIATCFDIKKNPIIIN